VGVHLALGLTGRSGPDRRRRAHTPLLGLTVGQDWPAMAAQLAGLPAPALVVLDGETELTTLTQQLWPQTPIQRCWWHLPHGLRKAFCLDPDLRARLARLAGPELGTGVLERLMRELNTRTDIGARPLERSRTALSAHRAHRTAATSPSLEGDQTGHPPAQHHPILPAKVQRLTTLPHLLPTHANPALGGALS
jgi:hypothetical protein